MKGRSNSGRSPITVIAFGKFAAETLFGVWNKFQKNPQKNDFSLGF